MMKFDLQQLSEYSNKKTYLDPVCNKKKNAEGRICFVFFCSRTVASTLIHINQNLSFCHPLSAIEFCFMLKRRDRVCDDFGLYTICYLSPLQGSICIKRVKHWTL
jgi:hypothetical protein